MHAGMVTISVNGSVTNEAPIVLTFRAEASVDEITRRLRSELSLRNARSVIDDLLEDFHRVSKKERWHELRRREIARSDWARFLEPEAQSKPPSAPLRRRRAAALSSAWRVRWGPS